MATRAVNKTAKEGEQNARLLLSRGALSAMAIFRCAAFPSVRRWRCTAPHAACPSRASTLSCVLLAGAFSKSCLRCRFFCGEGGSYLVWGESRRSSMARSSRMRSRATGSGNILARCVPGRSTMAKCSRNAFPSVRQWQDCARMRSWPDWQRQYSRAMRPQVPCRGKISPRCVPGRQSVASFALHASRKWPRTGKSPVRGKIRAPCIRKRAPFGKICAPCIRKALQTAFRERTARRSCQEGPLFAARAPRIMHGAQILPSAVASNRPSARNTGAAEQREPPKLDRTTQETQPRRQRPRRLLGSKHRQQLPRHRHRFLPTPASSLSPGEQLCHRRQRLLWRQHPRRHRPADSPSCARPKGGLSSLLVAPVFCALGRCDRLINARRSPFYAIISLWLRKNRHPSGKTQALPIQWVGCSRGHVPYRTINKEKRLRWQLLHIALSARKRRKW